MRTKRLLTLVLSLGIFALICVNNAGAQIGTTTTARTSNRQTQTLLVRIETKIDILKEEAQRFAERGGNAGSTAGQPLGDYLVTLEESTTKLHEALDARQPINDEVTDVLNNATAVNQFMAANRVTASAQSQWRSLKTDLTTLATYNRVSWNWNRPVQPLPVPVNPGYPSTGGIPAYTVSDAQMQTLLSRIELKTGIYKRQMDAALNQDQTIDVNRDRTVSLSNYITGFEGATTRLKQRFDARQSVSADASEVLRRATYIDQYMTRNTLTPQAQAQWRNLRGDLNTLANYYRVSWDWRQTLPVNPDGVNTGGTGRGFDARLTGTYRLNTGLSDDTATVIDRALGSSTAAQSDIYRTSLERRLRPPEMIAIEKNNTTVSLASSILPQVTFEADGVARTETNSRGRTITTTATADRDGLIINYQGERASDFYVTFMPTREGQLKVTRRIYLENSSEAITASSVYDKIDPVARWTTVNNGTTGRVGVPTVSNDAFVIPNGMRLSAELRDPINTYGNQRNDRFTMAVTSPTQYRGALITGRIVNEDNATRVAGRTRVLLNFDTITLPGGQSYRFAGTVDAVVAANGDNITVTNRAAVATGNQNTRAGVGSILGALLGAIAGQPAANVNADAGTILTQSRDNIDLGQGSRFVITASSPNSVGSLR
jgi:hypothetical protein